MRHYSIVFLVALSVMLSSMTFASAALSTLSLSSVSLSTVSLSQKGGEVDLPTALMSMLQRHPALMGKQAQIESKDSLLKSAKAEKLPSLDVSYGEDRDGNQEGAFIVKQPLWAFGRIDTGIDYADIDLSAETIDKLRLTRELLEDTAIAYANVVGVQDQLLIIEDNIAQHQAFLEQIQRRQEGRLASQTDTQLAASRLTQAKVQQIQMQGDLRDALMSLQTLAQLPMTSVSPIFPAMYDGLPDDDTIEQQVLKQSAEVQYKEQLVSLAIQDVYQKRASFMPTLYLKFSHEYSDNATYPDDSRLSLVMEGGLEGLGMITRYQEQSAHSQLRAAQRDVEVTQFELTNRLNSLLLNRKIQQSLIDIHQSSIEQLSSTLASYQRQYKSGRKEWLDVLNIQREITEQKIAQAKAENSLLVNLLSLAALTGGLDIESTRR
ncbi:TolC family protein [Marinomonas sp. M1K-6]|uniref:TolC family protein n=1 Tax=Marinomonas profundi TaxID=2726122 RepID=A0A847R2Q3_9GAMM|nr:TolC family protein [Marinomonas profundi]NLQ18135.1 TolC family protein [Marinomonas profundi]UDV04081.1 TolC family protein [Marinomonas profundi]